MAVICTTMQERLDYNMGVLLRGLREAAAHYDDRDGALARLCLNMAAVLAIEGWEGLDMVVETLSKLRHPEMLALAEDMRTLRRTVLAAEART